MRNLIKYGFILMTALTTGCKDDIVPVSPVKPAYTGDEVVFQFGGKDRNTRTTYVAPWSEETTQQIHWGNYNIYKKDVLEKIKIFCRQTVGEMGIYTVNPSTTGNLSVAQDITKSEEGSALVWGEQGKDYEFCAFYPADKAGNAFVGTTGQVIEATVENAQWPQGYKIAIGDAAPVETNIDGINTNNEKKLSQKAMIYVEPDMEAAIMMAKTTVSGTPDETTGTGFGYPVNLDFHVLADVLDLTINGPVTPNNLGGNGKSNEWITIQGVTIQNKTLKDDQGNVIQNPNAKDLAGSFQLDMSKFEYNSETGQYNINGDPITILQGSPVITINTVNQGKYPTLFARQENTSETPNYQYNEVDHMRMRVFLIPNQVKNLNELEVVVHTNFGDYTQELGNSEMVTGAIHPINLPHFEGPGQSFDFTKWISQLDPDIYLSELSIPGAWHSANPYYQGNATLYDLYDAGIRAFETHTTCGTIPYTDNTCTTELNATTAANREMKYIPYEVLSVDNISVEGGNLKGGSSLSGSRNVTVTDAEVTITTSKFTLDYKPDFAVRLYRTSNVTGSSDNPATSYSDHLVEFQKNKIGGHAFVFLQIGYKAKGGRNVTIPIKEVVCNFTGKTMTFTKKVAEIKGTQTRDWNWIGWGDWKDPTFTEVPEEFIADFADAVNSASTTSTSYSKTMTLTEEQAWPIAVQTCIQRTAKDNACVTDEITAFTTIRDVYKKIIFKVNTNNDGYSKTESNWGAHTYALFSRWEDGAAQSPMTVNLKWGSPIAPEVDNPTAPLHWCYIEGDNISSFGGADGRKTAINLFRERAYLNYQGGLHRTFYECSIGGYITSGWTGDASTESAVSCQTCAKQLNPYLYEQLTDPTKPNAPFGQVFMNYAIPPKGEEDTYKSDDLIRAIINNNRAFLLNRRKGTNASQSGGANTINQGGNLFKKKK